MTEIINNEKICSKTRKDINMSHTTEFSRIGQREEKSARPQAPGSPKATKNETLCV